MKKDFRATAGVNIVEKQAFHALDHHLSGLEEGDWRCAMSVIQRSQAKGAKDDRKSALVLRMAMSTRRKPEGNSTEGSGYNIYTLDVNRV